MSWAALAQNSALLSQELLQKSLLAICSLHEHELFKDTELTAQLLIPGLWL